MKILLTPLLALLLIAASTRAEDNTITVTTTKGRTYTNARVTKVEADAITIRHANGIARVQLSQLPKELQEKYNYDPIAAAKAKAQKEKQQTARNMALQQQRKAKIQRDTLKKQRENAITIKGEILQVTDTGLLLTDCTLRGPRDQGILYKGKKYPGGVIVEELHFIQIDTKNNTFVDGGQIDSKVIKLKKPYTYIGITGAKKTIEAWKLLPEN